MAARLLQPALLLALLLGALNAAATRSQQAAAAEVNDDTPWASCAEQGSTPGVDVKEVSLTPDKPVPGHPMQFSINGTSRVEAAAGTLEIRVWYMGLAVYSEAKDLCERTACPIAKGPLALLYEQDLPIITPPGPYTMSFRGSDAAGAELLCINYNFTVVPPWGGGGGANAAAAASAALS